MGEPVVFQSLVFKPSQATTVMNKIIKRLEIVKSAIELEDEEIIFQQVAHLKNEPLSVVPGTIVQAIEARRFSDALREITAWLQSQRAVSTWQDPAIAASKLELKALETQLRDLIDKRNTRIQILDDFNDLYHLRLGPLMSRILELRKQLAASAQRKQEAERKRREKTINPVSTIFPRPLSSWPDSSSNG